MAGRGRSVSVFVLCCEVLAAAVGGTLGLDAVCGTLGLDTACGTLGLDAARGPFVLEDRAQ